MTNSAPLIDVLATLPEPRAVTVDYEALLAEKRARFVEKAAALGIDAAALVELESSPVNILLQEDAYSDTLLLDYINDRYRSRLLYFGRGSDADNNAEDHGVVRLEGESDEAFIERVRIKNRGSSSAGPRDWWKYHARAASAEVEDVSVTRVPIGPDNEQRGKLLIAILSTASDGVPSEELLQTVRDAIDTERVRGDTTSIDVVAASSRDFNVVADVWLQPDAQQAVFDGLEQRLRDAIAATRALGWDPTPSWISAQLHPPGVQRVELLAPTVPVSVAISESARLGTVTLTYRGRDF